MGRDSTRSILLAIDGSVHANRAAEYVVREATVLGVREIIILNVQTSGAHHTHTVDGKEAAIGAGELGAQASAIACRLLDAARLPYRLHTAEGDPADAIAQAADTDLVDEIVIGSRGLSHIAGLTLGSVAYQVIHRTPLPVTVVVNLPEQANLPSDHRRATHRLLLAVYGSKHAASAVDYVCNLCRAGVRLEIELVHLPLPIPAAQTRGFASPEVVDLHNLEQGKSALRAAKDALQAAGQDFVTHIVPGDTAGSIVRLAQQQNCTRIVMGTRGLGTVAGLLLGSVAYKVIHLATVPVTLVK